ncbi:MAG: glycerophosphodiester phosphodiesterase [Bacteroidales bacterium]|jgi:glycerophosphoryl diester phosphodiesterase|nr:glycerophosphodiester phosphodiesterase [Bacteroidales bacterium]
MINISTYGQVEIIAHRGASYLAPENTVAASELAWELGADAVEVDIYLSRDNKIMCIHDPDTKRTTGQDYKVSETLSKQLRKLDAGSFKNEKYKGEKIPFLKEIIKSVPEGKELVVEIKCKSEVLPFLAKDVSKYGRNRKFVFICFDLQTIADTKKAFPDNKCYWLCANSQLLKQNLEKTSSLGLDGVSLVYGIIDNEIATIVKGHNLELFTWTVDDAAEAKRLITLGVRGITTNRPGWLRNQIF